MAYEMKENTGSLFKNEKATSENHPGYTGKVLIGGVMYWQSAWLKEANGKRYFSQSFKPVEAAQPDASQARSNQRPAPAGGSFDDEIPFSDPLRGRAALTV